MSRCKINRGQLTVGGPYFSHFCLKYHKIWHTYLYSYYNIAQKISCVYRKTVLKKYYFNASKKCPKSQKIGYFSNLLEKKAVTHKKLLAFFLSFSPSLHYFIFLPVSPPFYHFLCFTPHTLTFALFFSPSLFLSSSVHTLSLSNPLYLSTPPSTLLSPHLILNSPSLILIFLSPCLYFFLSLGLFPFLNSTFLSLPYFPFFPLSTLPPAFSLPIFISPPPPLLSWSIYSNPFHT